MSTVIVSAMLDHALNADNIDHDLLYGTRALRQLNEDAKVRKANLFQQAAQTLRNHNRARPDFAQEVRRDITTGIAQRIGVRADENTQAQVEEALAGYCEFHRRLLLRALENADHRFDSRDHLNDHFDGEQLIYLASPDFHFITTDGGFRCVAATPHGPRIHVLNARDLQNPQTAVETLEPIIMACDPVGQ